MGVERGEWNWMETEVEERGMGDVARRSSGVVQPDISLDVNGILFVMQASRKNGRVNLARKYAF